MVSFKEKQALLLEEVHTLPPLSPLSQCINSSSLSIPIIGVYELGAPLNRSQTATFLQDIFIPINDRFSSVIITDKKGMQRWKKVEVDIDEHILIPTFPSGLSREDYDDYTNEYLSKITMDPLPENRPLWNVHVIPYPSTNAEATLVFKINHAIGDGYSLIGALFSCLKRADDPSLPLTFPSMSSRMMQGTGGLSKWSRLCSFLTVCVNTLTDSARSVLFGTFLEDDKTAIRSGLPGVEYEPISISSITFSLDDLGRIQSKFGGTVNEAVTGIISYAIQLYMKRVGKVSKKARITSLVVLNARMLKGFKTVGDMLKANIWGNRFSLLHVSVPSNVDVNKVDPMDFVVQAKKEMRRRRNSMALFFNNRLLHVLRSIRGPEAASRYIYSTWKNASITMTSLVGPTQKMVIADLPINSFYFTLAGVPQSLVFTIVSYMGKLRVAVRTEKDFIDSQLFVSCMNEAYEKISEAAEAIRTAPGKNSKKSD